jgi:hypothetical protein
MIMADDASRCDGQTIESSNQRCGIGCSQVTLQAIKKDALVTIATARPGNVTRGASRTATMTQHGNGRRHLRQARQRDAVRRERQQRSAGNRRRHLLQRSDERARATSPSQSSHALDPTSNTTPAERPVTP